MLEQSFDFIPREDFEEISGHTLEKIDFSLRKLESQKIKISRLFSGEIEITV